MELAEAGRIMQIEKPAIIGLLPFDQPGIGGRFGQVRDNTQNSVFVQAEIENFTTEFTTGKIVTNPGNALMTHRVHNQRVTNLCSSLSTVTTVRGAALLYLTEIGNNENQIRAELENGQGQFSFNKMLTLFAGCISPRSLDGLIINSKMDQDCINAQTQINQTAIDRLVNKTALENFGWKRMTSLVRLLTHYNVDINRIELEKIEVFHPRVANGRMTFQDALGQNMIILSMILTNTLSSQNSPDDNSPHAVTMFEFDQNRNIFKIKNSYFTQKTIEIDERIPIFSEFMRSIPRFRRKIRQNFRNLTDRDWILADVGYCLRFRDRSKF